MFFYEHALPFQVVESSTLKELFKLLVPNFKLPTAESLGGELLNKTYLKVKENVTQELKYLYLYILH